MALESVTYISDLVATNPVGATDPKSQGDDHLRNIKTGLLNTFPNVNGAVNFTPAQANVLASLDALSVLGRASDSSGAPAAIAAAADGDVLRRSGTSIGFGKVADGALSSNVPLKNASNTFSNAAPIVLSATDAEIKRSNDTSRLLLLGGTLNNTANSSRLSLYGTSHATRAGDVDLDAGSGGNVAVTATGITLNGVNVTDFARLSQVNTFSQASSNNLNLFTTGSKSSWAGITAGNAGDSVTDGMQVGFSGSEASFEAGNGWIFTPSGVDLVLYAGGSKRAQITSAGVFEYGGIEVGYRDVPQVSAQTNYTTVIGDRGKHVLFGAGGGAGVTFTIPANASVAYPVGTVLTFISRNANNLSIAITSDTLILAGTTTTGTRTLLPNGVATAVKVTSTQWIISGAGLT